MTEVAGGEVASTETTDNRDYETEARDMGWVPEAEWKGDKKPAKFLEAKDFVERGEHIIPILKKRIDELQKTVVGITKVTDNTIKRMNEANQQEIANLKASRREAIKTGNVDLAEKYDAEIEKRKDEPPLTDDPKRDRADREQVFADANPWYGPNRKMTAFARGFVNDLAGQGVSMDDQIKQVLVAVREEFPEYFEKEKPAANGHAAVDGGSENGPAPSKGSPLAKLSAIERATAKEDMKKYPTMYPTEQSWVDAFSS